MLSPGSVPYVPAQQATAYGLPEVRLYTNEKMHKNLAVYARLGFEETGRGLDGGYRRVFLRKRLLRKRLLRKRLG